jgi:hypothetical protein
METNFKEITLRLEASSRGGGIEIALDTFGYKGEKMTAYQNYLGGGMLGCIMGDCTVPGWREDSKLTAINQELKQYFHSLTNHADDEWENQTFEQNQAMPGSAY